MAFTVPSSRWITSVRASRLVGSRFGVPPTMARAFCVSKPRFNAGSSADSESQSSANNEGQNSTGHEGNTSLLSRIVAGKWPAFLSKEAATERREDFNRWLAVPPASLIHISIGAIYCWSMWTVPVMRSVGVVAQAPTDFAVSEILPVFSFCAISFGVTSTFLGQWVERVGPRVAGVAGSLSFGAALAVSGLAMHFHSLPLLYAGYGVLGGIAWGFMYLCPVSSVMKWFPDRRGMATGVTLSAFGLGAALAPSLIDTAVSMSFVAPTYLGAVADVAVQTLPDGTQVLAESANQAVVVATEKDAATVGLKEGIYALGTGNSGAASAFMMLGALYSTVGVTASCFTKLPPDGWTPKGFVPDQKSTAGTQIGLTVKQAMTTRQFYLLWMTVFGNACGGLALISSSKLMMTDIFAGAMPLVVTSAFATAFVGAVGAANAAGRLGWAVASDLLGRKSTFAVFGLSIPLMLGLPTITNMVTGDPADGMLPLYCFYGGSVAAISFYGGIFSVLPAYIADLFGQKHAGAIHGRMLTAWAMSAVCGPMGLAYLRRSAELSAIEKLIANIDADVFQNTFGVDASSAQPLIESKTITIARLMEIAPPNTLDPTPFLYDDTCLIAASLLGAAAISNLLLRPPDVAKILAAAKAKATSQASVGATKAASRQFSTAAAATACLRKRAPTLRQYSHRPSK